MSQPFRDNLEFFGNQGNFRYITFFSISCQNVPYFRIFEVLLKGKGGIQGLQFVKILFYLMNHVLYDEPVRQYFVLFDELFVKFVRVEFVI